MLTCYNRPPLSSLLFLSLIVFFPNMGMVMSCPGIASFPHSEAFSGNSLPVNWSPKVTPFKPFSNVAVVFLSGIFCAPCTNFINQSTFLGKQHSILMPCVRQTFPTKTKSKYFRFRRPYCLCPGWVAQLFGAWAHIQKGYRFNSWSGYTPRLWVWSLVGARTGDNRLMFLSHIGSPSLPFLSLNINKHILRWGLINK